MPPSPQKCTAALPSRRPEEALAPGQMDQVTQQNAALVEQAAAAAQSLEEQADKLRETVATFQLAGR